MSDRCRGVEALAPIACIACASARADLPVERIGIGVALASPVIGPSPLPKLDERWSAGIVLGEDAGGIGGQVQVDYARKGSRGGYWTVSGGRSTEVDVSIVRDGYGYAWQKGPFRLHVEATLNVPFNGERKRDGLGGIPGVLATLFPIGLGVHYVFGER